jgi:hypothetical protein
MKTPCYGRGSGGFHFPSTCFHRWLPRHPRIFIFSPFLKSFRLLMKRFLRAAALSLLSLLGVASQEARASHAQGGDLRYESLGNNQYRVTVRSFRDCSGIQAETTLELNCRVGTPLTSCANNNALNRTVTLARVGQPIFGNQYCATIGGICTTSGPANHEENTYQGTVTLPAEQWTMSVEINARPATANLASGSGGTLRFEATLDNRNGLLNNSPNFGTMPVAFVGWKQPVSLSNGAFDIDGDSLVFSLVTPLTGCNTAETYKPYNGPGAGNANIPGSPGCTYYSPVGMPTTFSPTQPIATRIDTTGTCPTRLGQLTPFSFNPANGAVSFTPIIYDLTGTSANGNNKYVVCIKVDEYRRINGTYRNIGSARREVFLTVVDCGTNQNPRFANTMSVYGVGNVPLNRAISVRSGASTSVVLNATDPNTGQVLTLSANHLNVPGVYTQQTAAGTLIMEFTPPTTLPDGTYYITIKAEDNNCPVKGLDVQTLAFRVYGSPLSARAQANTMVSNAYPNPFTDQVTFTLTRPDSRTAQTVDIVNQLGQVVDHLTVPAGGAAEAKLTWTPAASVPAGVYLARFADGQQTVRLLHLSH